MAISNTKKSIYLLLLSLSVAAFGACEDDDTDFSEIIGKNTSGSSDTSGGSDTPTDTEENTTSTATFTYVADETLSKAVTVTYSSAGAEVRAAADIFSYLAFKGTGAAVNIYSSTALADEITYTLTGTSTNGSFYLGGSTNATVVMRDLSLTAADSAVINIRNGKRIAVRLEGRNMLADSPSNTRKGALMINGHSEFSGSGSLELHGRAAHALWADEYIELKKSMTGTLAIAEAVSDGINVNQYFAQRGGTLTIAQVGDDGLQVSADEKHGGYVVIEGGTLGITATAAAAKGIKAEGRITISDRVSTPTIRIENSGSGLYDSSARESKGAACLVSDGSVVIEGGEITLLATGDGGKGLRCDSTLMLTGGSLSVVTSGGVYSSNNSKSYPKGIKVGKEASSSKASPQGHIEISGGTLDVTVKAQAEGCEGIECENTIRISGGTINVASYDDCINSAKDFYITGGTVTVVATNNDGIDSNANLYIEGGTIMAFGGAAPECGLDAAEGYNLYFNGGTILAVGGSMATPAAASRQAYVAGSGSLTAGSTISLASGGSTLAQFTIPSHYTTPSGNGGRWGGMNSGAMTIQISCPGLSAGSTYTLTNGSASSSLTARSGSNTGGRG